MARGRLYTDYEVAFIIEHYVTKGRRWVAEQLGRHTSHIGAKAYSLGLAMPCGQGNASRLITRKTGRQDLTYSGPPIDDRTYRARSEAHIRKATIELGRRCAELLAKSGAAA